MLMIQKEIAYDENENAYEKCDFEGTSDDTLPFYPELATGSTATIQEIEEGEPTGVWKLFFYNRDNQRWDLFAKWKTDIESVEPEPEPEPEPEEPEDSENGENQDDDGGEVNG